MRVPHIFVGLVLLLSFVPGCSRLSVPNNVARLAIDFVPSAVWQEKDAQLHQLAMQLNPIRAAELRDSVIAPAWEFKSLHVVCGDQLRLSPAETANGIAGRWCVVVAGIGREAGEDRWHDIKRHVYIGRVLTEKGHEPRWVAVPLEDGATCPCSH